MFQFPALASCQAGWHSFRMSGCPIRKSSDQRLFAPTRSLSQLITSFIASESQGIRHAPLLTFSLTDNVWSIYTFSFNFTFFCYIMSKTVWEYSDVPESQEWRITDSNRWPPACKAGALANWANPPSLRYYIKNVVPGRFELPTSTLSVWRSNQLSYRTVLVKSSISAEHSLSLI